MPQEIQMVDVDKLSFDPLNPRFSSISFDKENDKEVIDLMIQEESLLELLISIADQGFFQGEPLLVYKQQGKLIVAEGNRRLGAVKVLNNSSLTNRSTFHAVIESAKHKPKEIPCIIFNQREDTLVYLGYKHITGNKKWGALEKAIYLSQLHEFLKKQDPNLSNNDLHRQLARNVGSQAPSVGKTLSAYAIYLKGNNNNKQSIFFDLQGVDQTQVDFSLIYTALGYENIYKYLGLTSSTDMSLDTFNLEHGKNLFRWLFKQNEFGQTAVSESRKLKELNKVLGSPEATKYFQVTNDLDAAYRLSAGPIEAFGGLIQTLIRDKEQLKILVHQIKLDIIDKKTEIQFLPSHTTDLESLWRDLRTIAETIEDTIRRG